EVEEFLDTPVKHYSSGMYVRLAFAVAAHLEPEILVIDEVLAVGDAAFHKKCLGKMGEVAGQGRTVLFVSHNLAAISALTSRGIGLRQGGIQFAGPARAAICRYVQDAASGQRTWSAPALHRHPLQILRAAVVSPLPGEAGELPVSEPVVVEVEYQVRRPLRN